MGLARKAWLALAGAAALTMAAPAAFASAIPAQPAPRATAVIGGSRISVEVPPGPGRHRIAMRVPVTALPVTAARSAAAPGQASAGVQVRVGKNNCGGFNGKVEYDSNPDPFPSVGVTYWIQIFGDVWDDCGIYTYPSTVYVYLSFNCLQCNNPVNWDVGHVYDGGPNNVSGGLNTGQQDTPSDFGPSSIKVDACLKWNNGWGCGPAKAPKF
jgi:hypothetical protein